MIPLLSLVLAGCGTGSETPVCDEGELLDGEECVPEACGTGPWGDLQTDGDTIYVAASAESGGDGSEDHPFTSIQEGLDAQQARAMVAVAAGTYVENLRMTSEQSGVHLAGRCRELVTVDASQGSEDDIEQGCGIYLALTALGSGWTVSGVTVTEAPWVGVYQYKGELSLERISAIGNERRGLAVEYGSVEATDCRIEGNREIAVYLSQGTFLLENMEILDTQPNDEGESGRGLYVRDGSLVATDCRVEGSHEVGILFESSEATLRGVEVLDTRSQLDGAYGTGIVVQDDSVLTATDCVVESTVGVGLILADSTVTLDQVRVLDTQPTETGEYGRGLQVQGETVLEASQCRIEGNHDAGVVIDGATATLTDCEVLDTRSNSVSIDGRGILAFEGATLTLTGSLVQGNTVSGLYGQDATLMVESTQFLDHQSGIDGIYGLGIEVWDGTALELNDCLVQGNRASGVYVALSCQVQVEATQVLDTLADGTGAFGHGMEVQVGSTLTASDLVLEGNREVALYLTGSTATLQDCRILDTQPNEDGVGVGIAASDADLEMSGTVLSGNYAVGLNASSSEISMVGCEVSGTLPNGDGEFGRGINVYSYSTLQLDDCVLEGNREIAVAVTNSTALLEDCRILDTRRGVVGTLGVALLSQKGALVEARGLEISDIEGVGLLVVEDSTSICEACTISDCGFAGGAVGTGELVLRDSLVENTGQDANAGGGIGVFASNYYGGSRLVVEGSTIRDNLFAAAYLEGDGSYQLTDNQLSGGQGIDALPGQWVHGDGVFVIAGEQNPTAWNETEETGVLISGNQVSENAGSGIFLDGASATLSGNTYQDNGVDLVQQRCDDVESPDGLDEEALITTDVCPTYDYFTSHPELHTYLTEAESAY